MDGYTLDTCVTYKMLQQHISGKGFFPHWLLHDSTLKISESPILNCCHFLRGNEQHKQRSQSADSEIFLIQQHTTEQFHRPLPVTHRSLMNTFRHRMHYAVLVTQKMCTWLALWQWHFYQQDARLRQRGWMYVLNNSSAVVIKNMHLITLILIIPNPALTPQ